MVFRIIIVFLASFGSALAEVCARDDTGQELCLKEPAQRIVTLSPGATELVFAAGAGEQVVAVVDYSDYPPAANDLPRVGSHTRIDLEALVALKPDVVITWVSGNPVEQLAMLDSLGIPQFAIEPRTFDGVSGVLEKLAMLAGTEAEGKAEAERFRQGIARLAGQYQHREPVRVFYQVWDEPLMGAGPNSFIGEILELSGGKNILTDVEDPYPYVSHETVIDRNPEIVFAPTTHSQEVVPEKIARQPGWEGITASKSNRIFLLDGDKVSRRGPRMIDALETMVALMYPERFGHYLDDQKGGVE